MSQELYSAIVAINGSVIIILMVTAGALATRLKVRVNKALNNEGCESLAKLILNVLLPCLVFTQMVQSIEFYGLKELGLILFFCTFHVIVGCLVGYLFTIFKRPEKDLRRVIMGCIGFQDSTIIPMIFINVIGASDIIEDRKDFKKKSISYILIYTIYITIYKWTLAYNLLRKQEIQLIGKKINESIFENIEIKKQGFLDSAKQIFNIPLLAATLSVPLALIPYLKQWVICGSGAVFTNNLFTAMVNLGNSVTPLMCVVLGSKISNGFPDSADISMVYVVEVLIGKFVVMPLVGLGIVYLMYFYKVIERVLALSMLIIYVGPSSLQLLMICYKQQNQVDNIAKVYLIMYLVAVIPMALWTMIFLNIFY